MMKKMKYKITGLNKHTKGSERITSLIREDLTDLEFPFIAVDTGERGQSGLPVVRLPNKKLIGLTYFDYEPVFTQ